MSHLAVAPFLWLDTDSAEGRLTVSCSTNDSWVAETLALDLAETVGLKQSGVLWLSPPFRRSVDGAAKTWDEWQFDEYAIGGMGTTLTQSLAFTLMRLVAEVKLSAFYSLRTSPMLAPSSKVAWLRPLDALVVEANEDLLQKWQAAADCEARWVSALAVLEDQYQASAPALGELVARAWPTVEPQWRWEG